MKYLYLIFRLFFCGHRWEVIRSIKVVNQEGAAVGYAYDSKCKKCGKIKGFDT